MFLGKFHANTRENVYLHLFDYAAFSLTKKLLCQISHVVSSTQEKLKDKEPRVIIYLFVQQAITVWGDTVHLFHR